MSLNIEEKNFIMDLQNQNTSGNKFVCPSDRQLALRAKLRSGWSSSKSAEPLRPEEQAAIISVIKRNEELESAERLRVGKLVERVEKIKQHAAGVSNPNSCRLCGETFGILRPNRIICEDCRKSVCTKCSVDINIRYHTTDKTKEIWLCRVCSETREMWKKSGAWFFKGLPNYELPKPSSTNSSPVHSNENQVNSQQRVIQSCSTTPTRNVRVKKLTIKVDDSSSSEEDDELGRQDTVRRVSTMSNHMPQKSSNSFYGGILSNTVANKAYLEKRKEDEVDGGLVTTVDGVGDIPLGKLNRDDSFRLRTFGSIRSFLDTGERKLSNSFFFGRQTSRSDSSQPEYDTISTSSTVATSASGALRRESNYATRRGSISSSWSISESSGSGNSATASSGVTSGTLHCRDPLLGWLEVYINYRENFNSLDCTMVRARDLPAMDASGLTDPFCKLNIITEEGNTKYSRWHRTKTIHKTRNPEFNETIQFVGVEPEELHCSYLYVAIFDDDKYGHDFLGAAKVSLLNVHISNQYRTCVPLCNEDQYSNEAQASHDWSNGKILLALCYNTKKRSLVVNVKQCINLIPMDNNGSSDPFVKIQLKPDAHRNKKHKTSVKWRTLNPIYNEEFFFEASPHDLNKQTLILTVWDKDLGKSNDFLGCLQIGFNSKGERLQQWHDCIRIPDHFHEKWHCLSAENPHH